MSANSPVTGNNSSPSTPSSAAVMGGASQNLRGRNKPRCIKCGSVARSRCPFQSCKKCCAKAENPCHIHVLKANATFPEKTPPSGSTPFDQQSTESSPSGASHRIASLRQLSNSFAQFNNLQTPLRSRRPVTKKEAAVINEWRFKKLKEYKEGIIDTENEAFDRYMENINLLEEVFSVNNKPEGHTNAFTEDSNTTVLTALRLEQRSNPVRSENFRKRVKMIVDQGLKKLRKSDLNHGESESNKTKDLVTKEFRANFWLTERESSITDLMDRLSKARNEEDLNACLEIKNNIFSRHEGKSPMQNEDVEVSNAEICEIDIKMQLDNYPPKLFSTGNVDQDALVRIDSRFSILDGIELL